jgi:tetratricopeptide (TPR) repeat protein
MLALAGGKLGEGEELSDRALALGQRAQPTEAIPVHRLQRYRLRDFRGGLEEVEPAIRDLVAKYPARPVFRCALAHLHARLARTEEARTALHDLGRDHFSAVPFDQEWLYAISLLADTSALLGDTESAPILYGLLLPWAHCNAADHAEGIRGSVSRYLGLLATMMARPSEAAQHYEDALDLNAKMAARPWLARTQIDYAQMLLAREGSGDMEKAQPLLSHASAIYQELGME